MKFEVDSKRFAERVGIAAEAASKAVFSMAGMSIEADAKRGIVTLRCADEASAAVVECPAEVEDGGELVIPARRLQRITEAAKDEGSIYIESTQKNKQCVISDSSSGEWVLTCVAPSIALPSNNKQEVVSADIPYALLRDLQSVVTPCCDDPTGGRPTLANFEATIRKDKSVCFAATDSYRIGVVDTKPKSRSKALARVLIPPVVANSARHAQEDRPIELIVTESRATLRYGLDEQSEARVSATVVEGKFPSWQDVVAIDRPGRVATSPTELSRAIRRTSVLFDDRKKAPIGVRLAESEITCFAKQADAGEDAHDSAQCTANEIAVNRDDTLFQTTHLLQALRACPDEELEIQLPEKHYATWAVVFTTRSGAQATSVVMPLRVS